MKECPYYDGTCYDGTVMTALLVDEVTVTYGTATALDRFSLDADSGEIVAVVGPSGSGKSTLLRAVAGLEPLAGGAVHLDGRDLSRVPTHKRGLGLMFQDHGLFSHLSVADNIAYGLRTAGVDKPTQRTRVQDLLALVDLKGFGDRSTTALSGGEAQRVALARALAPEPGLLMLDEPLGSLDRALRDQLTSDLRRLLTDLGQTALHVTHDQAEAFAVADRVVVVSEGRPVAVGSPAELWADPGSGFVARFLGHHNLWSVTVDGSGTVTWSGHELGRLTTDHPLQDWGPGVHRVVMPTTAIRPVKAEQLALSVQVVDSVFQQGLHDVSSLTTERGMGQGAVRFTTTDVIRPGDQLHLALDIAAMRPLVDD